jgi:hypothetical protein
LEKKKQGVKKLKVYSLITSFILVLSFIHISFPKAEAALLVEDKIYMREHSKIGGNTANCRFLNTTGTYLNIAAAQAGNSRGNCYIFWTFPPAFLAGKTLEVAWEGVQLEQSSIYVLDGWYDYNTSVAPTGFPLGSFSYQGNGILQTVVANRTHPFALTVDTFPLNFTAGDSSTGNVTLFIFNEDRSANLVSTHLYNMSIKSGASALYQIAFQTAVAEDLVCITGTIATGCGTASQFDRGYYTHILPSVCYGSGIDWFGPYDWAIIFNSKQYIYYLNTTWINVDNFTASYVFEVAFFDGYNWANFTYNAGDGSYNTIQETNRIASITKGSDILGDYGYNSTTGDLWLIFSFILNDYVVDAEGVVFYQKCYTNDIDSGAIADDDIIEIVDEAGKNETEIINNGTVGSLFEACAWTDGTVKQNQTVFKLRGFNIQYSIQFAKWSGGQWVAEDQFMQDFWHSNGGAEDYLGSRDWNLTWSIYGYDTDDDVWVQLASVELTMAEGDEGATTEWIGLFAEHTYGPTKYIDSIQQFNAFIEEEPAAWVRLYTDMWLSTSDRQRSIASRASAYYFGMIDSGWILWGSWSPMIANYTQSIRESPLQNNNGDKVDVAFYDYFKIGMVLNITEQSPAPGHATPYRVCIRDITEYEKNIGDRNEQTKAIDTPIFEAPKIPDLPVTGLLTPLYAAILQLGSWIVDAFSGLADAIWGIIGEYFPWFTDFWDALVASLDGLVSIFVPVFDALIGLFTWGADNIGLLATPFEIIGDTYDTLVQYTSPFFENQPDEVLLLLVLIVGFIPFIEAFTRGDTSFVLSSLKIVWGVASTLIDYTIRFARAVIQFILDAIPL